MCKCGCNTCETKIRGPLLTEGKVKSLLSEGLQYHIDKKIPLFETVYRIGSEKHLSLIREARKMYSRNVIDLCEEDEALIKTHLGEFGIYEGESVPLDLPMLNEEKIDEAEYQGKDVQLNKPKHGSSKFNSLKDIETALTHLIPGTKFERGNEFPSLEVGPKGYIAFTPKNSKNYGVISYRTSDWVSDNVGVLWINGDKHRGYEFTNIKELYSLLEKFKVITEAEYQGKDVQLNKPKRGGSKAYYVYVRDPKTKKVKKVSFGSGGLRAKIKNKEARNAFAKRHRCSEKKDRTKAGYWSCNLPKFAKLLGLGANMNTFW